MLLLLRRPLSRQPSFREWDVEPKVPSPSKDAVPCWTLRKESRMYGPSATTSRSCGMVLKERFFLIGLAFLLLL